MTSTMINYTDNLKGSMLSKNYTELDTILRKKYNEKKKRGLTLYEYINFEENNLQFKMYFDFDKKITAEQADDNHGDYFDEIDYIDEIVDVIRNLFNIEDLDDISVSEDNREIPMDKKGNSFKLSYHVIVNRKITTTYLHQILPKMKKLFKQLNIEFDNSVYSKGLQKFRIVMCKKDGDKKSLLKAETNADDLSKHLIQYIDEVEDIDCDYIDKQFKILLSEEDMKTIEYNNKGTIEDIIKTFDIVSEKKSNDCILYNIDTICPFVNRKHSNNHNYLIRFDNTLLLKCHSDNCCNKVKVLYKNVDTNTIEFDDKVFKSFDIEGDEKDNYIQKRTYFEKYYKYFKDTNTMYRIKNTYNRQFDYYERDICVIDKNGLMDLYYQVKDGEETKNKQFIKKYMLDPNKSFIFNIVFDPNNKDNSKYYNLFDGFNYENILNLDDEITKEDEEDFKFFLNYIKKYICEDNDNWFKYFIGHFALIIQQPTFLNHIIFLFYSSKQRTGKSNFTKFLGRVFGLKYCYFGSFKQIFDNPHSTAHLGTFLNIIEEINFSTSAKCEDQIKDYSQRECGIYNPKGKTEIKVNTFVRFIGTSNNSNALRITSEDQRFVVWEFEKIANKKIVDRLETIYQNKKMIFMFGEYLRTYKLPYQKRNDWILNRPITPAYKLMIFNDSIKTFMKDLYYGEDFFEDDEFILNHLYASFLKKKDTIRIPTNKLYEYYTEYCQKSGLKPFASSNFKKSLVTRFESIVVKRSNGTKFFIDFKLLKDDLDIEEEFINHIKTKTESKEEDSDED